MWKSDNEYIGWWSMKLMIEITCMSEIVTIFNKL